MFFDITKENGFASVEGLSNVVQEMFEWSDHANKTMNDYLSKVPATLQGYQLPNAFHLSSLYQLFQDIKSVFPNTVLESGGLILECAQKQHQGCNVDTFTGHARSAAIKANLAAVEAKVIEYTADHDKVISTVIFFAK